MNTQATLEKMRQLKLTAMGQAYQAFLSLPLQEQAASSVSATLAAFIDAEVQERQARKTLANVRAARFRYQASLEEIEYLPERNLDKHLLLQLWDTTFVNRGENLLITAPRRPEPPGRARASWLPPSVIRPASRDGK